ncbi:hypothetical protein CNMCM6106_004129 [Aspergillus hiratsukae]|uniref:Uncharacterized protein n=1 Tax=Aspergillus hiratsukae TaxID=1194566 RepID=A0A8H6Q8M6_9EURO|nr:hypothetical protein CNMCM6106_004129 [Aspergillus hiratsukae]
MYNRPEIIPLRAHPPRYTPRGRRRSRSRRFTPAAAPDPGTQRGNHSRGVRARDADPDCLRLVLGGDFQDVEWDGCPCQTEELGEGGGQVGFCG